MIEKLMFDKNQLWIIHRVSYSLVKTPVGKYAIITNNGIILQNGCVLTDGTYISNDDDLPDINDKYGYIREFKNCFSDDDDILENFEFNFCNILENKNVEQIFNDINIKIEKHNIKIHSIVNLHTNSYGICLNDKNKKKLGNKGNIFVENNSYFVLEINKNKMII